MGGPNRALLAVFWAPGGPGPIRKYQFGSHGKTADENVFDLSRLLKCQSLGQGRGDNFDSYIMIPFFEAAGNLFLHEMNTFWHNISWNPIYFIISCI